MHNYLDTFGCLFPAALMLVGIRSAVKRFANLAVIF